MKLFATIAAQGKKALVLGTLMTLSAGSPAVAAPVSHFLSSNILKAAQKAAQSAVKGAGDLGCPNRTVQSVFSKKCQPENKRNRPDLKIHSYRFTRIAKKQVLVKIVNVGRRTARPSVLMLKVRKINGVKVAHKINGVKVTRRVRVDVPTIKPGKSVVVMVNAKSILPKSIALKKTTFRLKADSTNLVSERNENNNTAKHKF